jgi:hypothetical protein
MALIGSGQLMAASTLDLISLLDVNETIIQDFSEGKMSGCTLECPRGALLPLTLSLKGEFLFLDSAAAAPMYLKILKTCYVRCEEQEKFLFSTDRQQWKEFGEFFTGELRASLHADSGQPTAGLELELNERKE